MKHEPKDCIFDIGYEGLEDGSYSVRVQLIITPRFGDEILDPADLTLPPYLQDLSMSAENMWDNEELPRTIPEITKDLLDLGYTLDPELAFI